MKSFALMLAGLLLLGDAAFAGDRSNNSDEFYQPNANVMELDLSYDQTLPTDTYAINDLSGNKISDNKINDSRYTLGFGWALLDSIAFRAYTGYAATSFDTIPAGTTTDTASRSSGMTDMGAVFQALVPFSGWNLHFGVGGTFGPTVHKLPQVTADGNESTGGNTTAPYIGLTFQADGGNFWGLKAAYIAESERDYNNNTPGALDYKLSGGNDTNVEAFYEFHWTDFSLDFRGGDHDYSQISVTYADGSTSSVDSFNVLYLDTAAQYQVSSGLNILVHYEFDMNPTYKAYGNQVQAFNHTALGARLRVEF